MDEKKLFLLDAYALIYRAYYALLRSPRVTSQGFNTSAIFGFVNTLEDVIRKENPAYMAVCFDPAGGHTFRHDAYPEYKAQRDKQPEDITLAVPYIKDIISAYGIEVVEVPGYEADDVIGTLSRLAEAEGFVTYMMTPDKDYGQLVTDSVKMYRPALRGEGFEIRGPEQVCERYGISRPSQVIDLLALEGDASDNVPGCPGVGEKTAAKLIAQWDTVENMLDHTDEIKGAIQRKIADNAEQIRFSKFLVTIKTDVPLPDGAEPQRLLRREPDYARLTEIFNQLEFKTLVARIAQRVSLATETAGPRSLFDDMDGVDMTAPSGVDFAELTGEDDIAAFVGGLAGEARVGVSVDAAGDDAMSAAIYGIALAGSSGAAYIHIGTFRAEQQAVVSKLAPLFAAGKQMLVGHDIKRDMVLLTRLGLEWDAAWYDTSVTHYLLSPEAKHDLPTVALSYLRHKTLDYELTAPERRKIRNAEPATVAERAALALRLYEPLDAELRTHGLDRLFRDIENPLVAVLARMEWQGVRLDVQRMSRLSERLTARLAELEEQVYQMAGGKFNIGSPAQVGEVLFGKLAIDPDAKRTRRGAWSTTEETLEKYAHRHPIVRLILDIRGLRKLLATYIDALPAMINPATGKIHTTFNQTATATGRISSSNPNLQNIPVRTDDGREIRRAFVAERGDLILSADYSQIELRLMADISGDASMLEAFNAGEDIHRATAAKIYHLPLAEVTDDLRRKAKTANFGIIYGISAFGLSERLSIPRGEAKDLIDGYMLTYPGVKKYMKDIVRQAHEQGYVTTIHGRKRFLPEIKSRNAALRGYAERNAINAPLQGSAADIIKIAMVAIDAEIRRRGLRSRMIIQVHDELVFNVYPPELAELQTMVTELMEHAYSGRVTLEVSSGTGENWLDAH
ncbi:MAG: DNA polymerase I [Bacteroides sp.]|nr:DNA polymerase I [Bacteroides sp.]MCM1095688.1 DNA polymerase I [Terasakiella sp.]